MYFFFFFCCCSLSSLTEVGSSVCRGLWFIPLESVRGKKFPLAMTLWYHHGEQKEKPGPPFSWCGCQLSSGGEPMLYAHCVTGGKLKHHVLSSECIESQNLDSLRHRKVYEIRITGSFLEWGCHKSSLTYFSFQVWSDFSSALRDKKLIFSPPLQEDH